MSTEQTPDPLSDPSAGENTGKVPMEEGEEVLSGAMEGVNPVESTEERVEDIEEEGEEVLSGAMASLSPPVVPLLEAEEEEISGAMTGIPVPEVNIQAEEEETLSGAVANLDVLPDVPQGEDREPVSGVMAEATVPDGAVAELPELSDSMLVSASAAPSEMSEGLAVASEVRDLDDVADDIEDIRRESAEDGKPISRAEAATKGLRSNDSGEQRTHYAGIEEGDTEEEAKEKWNKWNDTADVLTENLDLDEEREFLPQLLDKYNESDENKEIIRETLLESYSEEEAERIISNFENTERVNATNKIRAFEFYADLAEEDEELFEELMDAEDKNAFVRERMGEVELFQRYVEEQERSEQLRQNFLEEQAADLQAEQPGLSPATTVQLIEFGVSPDTLAGLPPEGVAAVERVAGRGGGTMLGALLSSGASHSDEAFTGEISGQFVSLDFTEGDLFLTGENAADRANQNYYRIDPPTVSNFVGVLMHAMGEQNDLSYIAKNPEKAKELCAPFLGDLYGEALPTEEGIDASRTFLLLLLGGRGLSEDEEQSFLQDLGILGSAGEVDASRTMLFREAIQLYVPDGTAMRREKGGLGMGEESPGFDHEDAVTLARLWDKDEGRFPESLSELKKLTQIRREGGDIHGARYI